MPVLWGIVLVGFAVGTLVGVSGVGAGMLAAPILISFGVSPTLAVGTDLAFSAVTKLVGSLRTARMHMVDRRWLRLLAVGGLPAALVGTGLTRVLPPGGAEHLVRVSIAAMLILAALAIAVREILTIRGMAPRARDLASDRPLLVVGADVVAGLLLGLTSIGGGAPLMLLLLAGSHLGPQEVLATGIASAAGLTAVAAASHLAGHTVDGALVLRLLTGSLPGVLVGGRLAGRIPARPLKFGLAALVLASGVSLMV